MNLGTFQYVPLGDSEIRVLHLLPGEVGDALEGYLLHKKLEPSAHAVPRYAALSYVWGDQSDREPFTVLNDGWSPGSAWDSAEVGQVSPVDWEQSLGTIAIGKNIASALQHMRSQTSSMLLWCDSICIDQENLAERAAQVMQMGEIYRLAASVIIWLGPEKDDSSLAAAALSRIGQRVAVDLDRNSVGFVPEAESNYWDNNAGLPLSSRELNAVGKFFDREWFKRLWVRQEIAVSRLDPVVVIGSTSISWSSLVQGHACIQLKKLLSPSRQEPWPTFKASVLNFWSIARLTHSEWDMSSLVDLNIECDCLDDRDRVYGLLGIIPYGTRPDIRPDYTLRVKDVYKNLVLSMGKYKDLDLLRFCAMSDTPTWVPDLHRLRHNRSYRLAVYSWASGDVQGMIRELPEDKAQVHAVRYGVITRSSSIIADGLADVDLISAVKNVAVDFLGQDPDLWDESSSSKLFEALVGGEIRERTSLSHYPSLPTIISVAKAWAKSDNYRIADDAPENERLVLHRLREMLQGMSCYQLEDGSFGLSLRGCQCGDSVWVILGCDIALALRGSYETDYSVVGPFFHTKCAFGDVLFGDMPEGWKMTFSGYVRVEFQHPTQGTQIHDPRLTNLDPPAGWVRRQAVAGQPYWVSNGDRSTVITRHPALDSDFLKRRGVKVETIVLK
jgi:hypothetical protein